ncbi:cob(I)yrinic acid a,c-diamide adenosyltransferase [Candidatus Woesearchaeota archaeon]|nr:cob(I)yrinic acid a,c-diamide adenosyltransferase [Candidatus Woesearchaeota archaeon]
MKTNKTGDLGETRIKGKETLSKDDSIIEVLGEYDELNCILGLAAEFCIDNPTRRTLERIQNDLHTVCAEISGLSQPVYPHINKKHVSSIEEGIRLIESITGKQQRFIIPGGTKGSAIIHLARAVSRRAERRLVTASKKLKLRKELLAYANRLSSLLYSMAVLQNRISSIHEKEPVYRHQETGEME